MARCGFGVPVKERIDVLFSDVDAILEAQQVLKQDFQRIG